MLVIGVAFGFIAGQYWPQSQVVAKNEEASLSEEAAHAEDSHPREKPREPLKDMKNAPSTKAAVPSRSFISSGNEGFERDEPGEGASEMAPASHKLNISISDELISDLEEQWNDLPNQVRLQREARGYRVIFLQKGSSFSRTGLRQGDLITRESLEELLSSENGDQELTARVVRIFGHVSSY